MFFFAGYRWRMQGVFYVVPESSLLKSKEKGSWLPNEITAIRNTKLVDAIRIVTIVNAIRVGSRIVIPTASASMARDHCSCNYTRILRPSPDFRSVHNPHFQPPPLFSLLLPVLHISSFSFSFHV